MERRPPEEPIDDQADMPEVSSTKDLTAEDMKKRLKRQSKGELIKFILHLLRTINNLEASQKD